jgi:large conductance mechanosensitive channel
MNMKQDLKKFIMRGNILDLAVAFILGASFNSVVQSLVKNMLTPIISAIGGQPNFANYYFSINHSKFLYGDFVNSLISFIIIVLALFFLIVQPLNKLIAYSKKHKTPIESTDKKCPECLSVIAKAATRCAFCGIKLINDDVV